MDNNPYPLGYWLMAQRIHTETREALILQVLRLPLSIGDSSGHERSPLEAFPFPDGATVRPEPTERPQPTGKPAAASILTEGSLNDNKIKQNETI